MLCWIFSILECKIYNFNHYCKNLCCHKNLAVFRICPGKKAERNTLLRRHRYYASRIVSPLENTHVLQVLGSAKGYPRPTVQRNLVRLYTQLKFHCVKRVCCSFCCSPCIKFSMWFCWLLFSVVEGVSVCCILTLLLDLRVL